MRIALIILLAIHGGLHLLGFALAWHLGSPGGLSGRVLFPVPESAGRAIGVIWLIACLLLVGTAVLVMVRAPWWPFAMISVAVSQVVVIYAWPDAKAGTVPNLLIAVAVVIAAAQARFDRTSEIEVDAVLAHARAGVPGVVVQHAQLAALPAPVARWLDHAGVVGKPPVHTVRLTQRGALRVAPDKPWLPTTALQHFNVDQPGFVWTAWVTMMHVLPISARDSYHDGRGRMQVELASLFPMVDATGPKLDEGAMQRFLAEIVWFPSAALASYIHWAPIDNRSARATMTYEAVTASVVFTFDQVDRVTKVTADRYYNDSATRERWVIPITEWAELAGVTMPIKGEVEWELAGGSFSYFRWEVTALRYDPPAALNDRR